MYCSALVVLLSIRTFALLLSTRSFPSHSIYSFWFVAEKLQIQTTVVQQRVIIRILRVCKHADYPRLRFTIF